jgi:hypothetical protein
MLEIIVITSELEFRFEPTSDVPESETDTHNVKTFSAWCKRSPYWWSTGNNLV